MNMTFTEEAELEAYLEEISPDARFELEEMLEEIDEAEAMAFLFQ
jgi:hypothetical protein